MKERMVTSLGAEVAKRRAGSSQSVEDVLQGPVDLFEDLVGPERAVDMDPLVATAVEESTLGSRWTLSTTQT